MWQIPSSIIIIITATIFTRVTRDFGNVINENETVLRPSPNSNFCRENPCGKNADWFSGGKYSRCRCSCGFYGNPRVECQFLSPSKVWRAAIWVSALFNSSYMNFTNEEIFKAADSVFELKNDKLANALNSSLFVSHSLAVGELRYVNAEYWFWDSH